VLVDLAPITTPRVFSWAAGSCHTFRAATKSGDTGIQCVQAGTPAIRASLRPPPVNFGTPYYLTTAAGTAVKITPPSGYVLPSRQRIRIGGGEYRLYLRGILRRA
jgi:hypothetical protein